MAQVVQFRADEDYLFYRNMRGIMLYAGIDYIEHCQLWTNKNNV